MEEWPFSLPGYPDKRVKSFEFTGTLGHLQDALDLMTSWRLSTGANLAIVLLKSTLKHRKARPTQGAWLVRMYPIPGSTALMTIRAVELRPAGKTRVECYDGFWADMPSATSMGTVFDEFVAELSKRLKVVDELPEIPAHLPVEVSDDIAKKVLEGLRAAGTLPQSEASGKAEGQGESEGAGAMLPDTTGVVNEGALPAETIKLTRRPRQDVIKRVAFAFWLHKRGEVRTLRAAATRAYTTTDSVAKYKAHPEMQAILQSFERNPEEATKFRQELSRREASKDKHS